MYPNTRSGPPILPTFLQTPCETRTPSSAPSKRTARRTSSGSRNPCPHSVREFSMQWTVMQPQRVGRYRGGPAQSRPVLFRGQCNRQLLTQEWTVVSPTEQEAIRRKAEEHAADNADQKCFRSAWRWIDCWTPWRTWQKIYAMKVRRRSTTRASCSSVEVFSTPCLISFSPGSVERHPVRLTAWTNLKSMPGTASGIVCFWVTPPAYRLDNSLVQQPERASHVRLR